MFDEISLSGEKAIKLLLSDGFPSDNRFGLRFYDGNEAGEDEEIASFDDGYICTPTRRYPFSWLRKPDAELIITSKPAELETFLASLSTPFENRMNSVNMRLQAMGFPVAVNTTTLEDREFVLRHRGSEPSSSIDLDSSKLPNIHQPQLVQPVSKSGGRNFAMVLPRNPWRLCIWHISFGTLEGTGTRL